MYLWSRFEVFGSNLPDLLQCHKNTKAGINFFHTVFALEQGVIWREIWSLTLWMTICIFVPFIWGFSIQFPWLAVISKCIKTGITLTRPLHLSKVSFDAKSAVEHFEWLSVYTCPRFVPFVPNFLDFPKCPKYTKIDINHP